jgi:bifunctional non-homologous end joining protein LigD
MARTGAAEKLAKYRSKRDFTKTSEPSGAQPSRSAGHSFVIQQHAARRLHYDFRLELDGVLLSWAVPKGPSVVPGDKRLAVRVEDHPLEYADFEGIIPNGEYGSGTVVVWDRGTWQPDGDAGEAVRKGRLTFSLHGHKLRGKWHLIRTKRDSQWLLFKSRDDGARDVDIVATEPKSVLTGRTLEEVARDADRTWHSDPEANVAPLVAQLPLGFPVTNLDKVLYPADGITKGEVIAYLAVVADWMLPHVAERPLTLVRCPEGLREPCFFQKKILPGSPAAIGTVAIREEGGEVVPYMKVHDMPGVVGLGQLGTLEIHVWGCHADKLERPDFMVFDLDPDDDVGWDRVALGALEVRRRLRELELDSWVKTTGGKGLHVCVPIARRIDWDDFKAWSKAFADRMAAAEPKLYTTNMSKAARRHKIYVDYLRNGRNATFVAPYSPRARPGAPVSVPITWEELASGVDPATYTIRSVPGRLGKLPRDPWAGIGDADQAITAAAWRAVGGKP